MKPNELESQALKLTPKKRARLARKLLLSLDSLSEAEIEQLWAQEAVRREAEIDSGRVKLVPADKALRQARQRLQ
jgi:putative addiction module component (TIGR02574 family)